MQAVTLEIEADRAARGELVGERAELCRSTNPSDGHAAPYQLACDIVAYTGTSGAHQPTVFRLPLVALTVCAGCYAPDAPECTLACALDTDCIGSQACTRDGFCAASAATECAQRQLVVDASSLVADAQLVDAGHGSGGTTMVSVHVTVQGNGTVTASTGTVCAQDCTFTVAQGVPMTFNATPNASDQVFQKWSGDCTGQPALCHATPVMALAVGAKFKNSGG